jgi:signal recognition particle GTPase
VFIQGENGSTKSNNKKYKKVFEETVINLENDFAINSVSGMNGAGKSTTTSIGKTSLY